MAQIHQPVLIHPKPRTVFPNQYSSIQNPEQFFPTSSHPSKTQNSFSQPVLIHPKPGTVFPNQFSSIQNPEQFCPNQYSSIQNPRTVFPNQYSSIQNPEQFFPTGALLGAGCWVHTHIENKSGSQSHFRPTQPVHHVLVDLLHPKQQ
jgi:hypothetical protein